MTPEVADHEAEAVQRVTAPGIYSGIPAAMYHRMEAVASHMLQGFYRTPAHAKEAMLHPFDSTKDQMFGQAFHARVLEPHLFGGLYLVAPKIDRRTKVGKAQWAAFEQAAAGRFLLEAGDRDLIEDMARAVESHPSAREILAAPGMNEVTVIWDQKVPHGDDYSVVRCRARLDMFNTMADDSWIWDLKSTRDASSRGFEREIATYRYHMQLGWYAMGLEAHHPAPRRAGFIAVEKERPHCVHVLELDGMDLEQGQREAREHLRQYVHCMATGIFPGYADGMDYVGLPEWARREA